MDPTAHGWVRRDVTQARVRHLRARKNDDVFDFSLYDSLAGPRPGHQVRDKDKYNSFTQSGPSPRSFFSATTISPSPRFPHLALCPTQRRGLSPLAAIIAQGGVPLSEPCHLASMSAEISKTEMRTTPNRPRAWPPIASAWTYTEANKLF